MSPPRGVHAEAPVVQTQVLVLPSSSTLTALQGGASQSELTHHRPGGSWCRSTEATPFRWSSFCWRERKPRIRLKSTGATQPSPPPCFPHQSLLVKSIPSRMFSSVSCLPLVYTTTMYRTRSDHALSSRTAWTGATHIRRVNHRGSKKRCEVTQLDLVHLNLRCLWLPRALAYARVHRNCV